MKSIAGVISPLIRPVYGGLGSILMFHRVCPPSGKRPVPGASSIEYSPERFESMLDHIQDRGYQFLSLDEIHDGLINRNINRKFVAITFDDGYEDNLTIAYPILKKRRIPFTIYITTSFPDGDAILWWYLLEDLLNRDKKIRVVEGQSATEYDLSDPKQRNLASFTIRKIMKSSHPSNFKGSIHNIFITNGLDPKSKVKDLALSWEQILDLSKDPLVTIGAHTVNHYLLKQLEEEQAVKEIVDARAKLASKLRQPVDHFAYPFGGKLAAGEREFRLVKELGFKTATTTRTANIFLAHANHLTALPRLDMGMFSTSEELTLALDGYIPARMNHFQRVVTL